MTAATPPSPDRDAEDVRIAEEMLPAGVEVLPHWDTTPPDAPLAPLIDARHLRLIRRFPIPSKLRARQKPQPCTCPGPYAHPFCWVVTCPCDHGIGAP